MDQDHLTDLLAGVAPQVIGARLARARQTLGLSVRALAKLAQVNKNSVLHIESGGAARPSTVAKLCRAMGLHVAAVARPDTAKHVAVHRHSDDRWYTLTGLEEAPVANRPLTAQERLERSEAGRPAQMLMLRSRLENGQLLPNMIELYGPSEERTHPGEETLFVFEGTLLLTVGGTAYVIDSGESATFWCSEAHSYAPAEGSVLPVRLISVTVQQRR